LSAKMDKTYPEGLFIGDYTAVAFGATILTHDIAIPRSRQDPKIGGKDDAEIISDRIAKLAPFPRDFVA